jgi:hypothetical protein
LEPDFDLSLSQLEVGGEIGFAFSGNEIVGEELLFQLHLQDNNLEN